MTRKIGSPDPVENAALTRPKRETWVGVGLLNAAAWSAGVASMPLVAEAMTVSGRSEAAAGFFTAGFMVALVHAVILGAPAYAVLRNRIPPYWYVGVIGGAVIGVLPITLFTLPMQFSSPATSASVGGVTTVVNGVTTLAGWREWLSLEAMVMAIGATGGLAFWLTFKAFKAGPKFWSVAASSFAGLAVAAAALAPFIVHDRSCHQVMTHGRKSIAPSFGMQVEGGSSEWPAVKQALNELAREEALDLREDGDPSAMTEISLCRDSGTVITTMWGPFMDQTSSSFPIEVSVYQTETSSDWRSLAAALQTKFQQALPGKATVDKRTAASHS